MTDRNDAPQYPIDAITLLKTDHRKIKNLFARYESAGDFRVLSLDSVDEQAEEARTLAIHS